MISRELGNEYQRVFGDKPFEVITDGVATEEISQPEPVAGKSPVTIYFAGLLHIDYLPLFNVLADSLEVLAWQAIPVKLILRGTSSVGFLNNRSFEVEYKQGFVTDEEVKKELDAADILYLPIKFNLPAFYLYSLSTKMVSYLGGCGTILYHGPKDSAACNFLRSNQGAICCTTLEVNDLANAVKECLQTDATFSANAKKMAFDHFLLSTLQNRFWQIAK
jgi:hypothetical protein